MRASSIEDRSSISPSDLRSRSKALVRGACAWLSAQLARPNRTRVGIVTICAIFFLAFSIRLIHWQDSYAGISQRGPWMSSLYRHYKNEALRIRNEGGILFPRDPVDPGDARLIIHPPGYSAFMAAIFALLGDSDSGVVLTQIILDALSAVIVLLIGLELFNAVVATIAAALVALSPHFSYHSLWGSPDTLCVLPILVAVYLILKTVKRPRLITIIGAGAMIGLSCWLRANALLLAPVLAVALMILTDRARRLRHGALFVGAAILVVSPITVRNWILYHHFIPISIAGGENLVVGIADFDKEERFGMPASDGDAAVKDAEWYNREEYALSPWYPDGVERDQARYARGLKVLRSNPGWFLGVMAKRAAFMLRYNDSGRDDWPLDTSRAPVVAAELPSLHLPSSIRETQPVWSSAAPGLVTDDTVLSKQAEVTIDGGGQTVRIAGDASEFGDQFASAIAVKPGTDYVLRVQLAAEQGRIAAKVTSADRRIALSSEALSAEDARKKRQKHLKKNKGADAPFDPAAEDLRGIIQMVFASGDRSEVLFVIANNGAASAPPITRVGQVQLFELGATPLQWTRYPRALIRGMQKNLFKTNTMLPLVIAGVLLMALAGRGRAVVVLLAVPAYYVFAQSALSTEYRYILGIHYFLFMMAAAALYCVAMLAGRVSIHLIKLNRRGTVAAIPMPGERDYKRY